MSTPQCIYVVVLHTDPPTVEISGYLSEQDAKKYAIQCATIFEVETSVHSVGIPCSDTLLRVNREVT